MGGNNPITQPCRLKLYDSDRDVDEKQQQNEWHKPLMMYHEKLDDSDINPMRYIIPRSVGGGEESFSIDYKLNETPEAMQLMSR